MTFLSHPFPLVRRSTSEHLYTTLITQDIIITTNEELTQTLLETDWTLPTTSQQQQQVERALHQLLSI
jgi:signal recognition particle GTPase